MMRCLNLGGWDEKKFEAIGDSTMNQRGVLVFLVRVGIAFLGIATLLYVFWPATLNLFADILYPHQLLTDLLKGYPGFNQDWLSVTSLITVSAYIYGYLAVTLFTSNFLYLRRTNTFQLAEGRDQWNILSYVIVGRLDHGQQESSSLSLTTDYRSMSSVIRAYSKSREGIGSVLLDVVTVIAVSYIGYTSLQAPSTDGSLLTRLIDALMVGLWCYCIFSILLWFVFVLVAWFKCLGR